MRRRKKKEEVDDTPVFEYYEEHYEEMMEEMKKDEGWENFEIPDDWDKDFRDTIERTLKEQRQEQMRKKIKRFSTAAAAVAAVVIAVNCSVETVQGFGLIDVIRGTFDSKDKSFVTFGTDAQENMLSEIEQEEIIFDTETLDVAYEQIRQELLAPMFYVGYIPEGYILVEAKYNKEYGIINLRFENEEKIIYISQQIISDENTIGVVTNQKKCGKAENRNIRQEILLYESEQDAGLIFNIENSNMVLSFVGMVELEECKKIAESIYYE